MYSLQSLLGAHAERCGLRVLCLPTRCAAPFLCLGQTMKLGDYLASGGQKAAIEGSTHYGRSGDRIAAGLAEVGGYLRQLAPLLLHRGLLQHAAWCRCTAAARGAGQAAAVLHCVQGIVQTWVYTPCCRSSRT